ncbi:hypothetical protein ASG89_09295 [Paenibacillus sp. Soil766]|uniref:stalk domain-containing protein n=1 Tax=Paenibacillus sp. Soil766 TaxID=1736404 RepID=UPI00070CE299|nr:stalk domain-containing protein [Paenibacillus sp. Soil766]KRE90472.1 hypothetical protein ASG89_09295 [Paenibacillus sp. Soil766]
MKRIFFVTITLLLLVSSWASASSLNGDFEGNPIISVKTNGQDLKVEDVPAIIYKDRTMVPIYLLKQLGLGVAWNSSNYSVNVTIPQQSANPTKEELVVNDHLLIENTYHILRDLDEAMWKFVNTFEYYEKVDNPSNYTQLLDEEYKNLMNQHIESVQLSLKIIQSVKSDNQIDNIMKSQAKALGSVTQLKNLLSIQISPQGNSQIAANLKISMLDCLQVLRKNIDNTKKIEHDLLLKEMEIFLQ